MASAWESAIKISLGKLRFEIPFAFGLQVSGFENLPITFEHAERVANLPHHHRDPFDRMLVAQAQIEGLVLMTGDSWCVAYDVPLLTV
jgi:PIN domain nuclease of toxin-antitoxin system